jgi:excisionase family DNA binding protein
VTRNATPAPSPKLLTTFEVATILRVSKQTVYRLVHAGDLEAIQIGRAFRIPEHAIMPRPAARPMPANTEYQA